MTTLSRILTFPRKSGASIDRSTAQIGLQGIVGDRRWMVVSPEGRFLTGRTLPGLVRIRAVQGDDNALRLSVDGDQVVIPQPPQDGSRVAVTVWNDTVEALLAVDGGWLSARLGRDCQLVYMDASIRRRVDPEYARESDIISFSDGFPVLLISEGSLADLNSRLTRPVTMDHFRPNLVVRDCPPFAEDGWKHVRIGEAEFTLVKRCARCVFTTIDPVTGVRDSDGEPLRTLADYRKAERGVMFGQNLLVTRTGRVAVGDTVMVVS